MTSRIRFSRAADVFEAFPSLARSAAAPTDDVAPLDYARRLLASERSLQAIVFMAHLLPRREAVWWGRQCVGAALGAEAEGAALRAADSWVRAPDEDNRRSALAIGASADERAAATYLALAAGRSGGSLAGADQAPVPAPPDACAQSVQAAVVIAICTRPPPTIPGWIAACVEAGLRFADGGDAKVTPPAAA